jgi:hypothetical protein
MIERRSFGQAAVLGAGGKIDAVLPEAALSQGALRLP